MRDVLFVAATAGFFGLCWAYLKGCARIVGDGPDDGAPGSDTSAVHP